MASVLASGCISMENRIFEIYGGSKCGISVERLSHIVLFMRSNQYLAAIQLKHFMY